MRIDVRELEGRGGSISAEDSTTLEDPLAGEIRLPCAVELDYQPSAGGFHLHATVAGEWNTRCQRCLEPIGQIVRGEFDLMVRRGEHGGEEADDVVVLAPNEYEVTLDPFIHETVVVNAPMVAVCSEDCRGLCPVCGTNRNRAACSCAPPEDPRWEALRRLK